MLPSLDGGSNSDAWRISLSASKRVAAPQQAGLLAPDRRPMDSFPRPRPQWISSTAPRLQWRVRAGLAPASLFSSFTSHLSAFFTYAGGLPASPPTKG